MVYVAINSYVVDNKCYIPTGMKNTCYLSYLTFDTTSYQSQEPNDKRVRSAKLIAHVIALRRLLHASSSEPHPFPCLPGIQRAPPTHPFLANQCLCQCQASF